MRKNTAGYVAATKKKGGLKGGVKKANASSKGGKEIVKNDDTGDHRQILRRGMFERSKGSTLT